MNKLFTMTFLVAVCLAASSCIFQTSKTTISGRVLDDGNRPVADATVSFGGTGSETTVKSDADGKFTVTARHRPTQMLRLNVTKAGVGSYSDEFPGFAAPDEVIQAKLMATLGTIPATRK